MVDLIALLRSRTEVPTTYAIQEIEWLADNCWTLRIECRRPDMATSKCWWTRSFVEMSAKLDVGNRTLLLERYTRLLIPPSSKAGWEELQAQLVVHSTSLGARTSVNIFLHEYRTYVHFHLEASVDSKTDLSEGLKRLSEELLPRIAAESDDFTFFLNASAMGFSPWAGGNA